MDEDAIPQLLEGDLDRSRLTRLFEDLASCAEIVHVQVRASGADRRTTLEAARDELLDGRARAVQIRYRFQDEDWCDTLLARDDGSVRLVRAPQTTARRCE